MANQDKVAQGGLGKANRQLRRQVDDLTLQLDEVNGKLSEEMAARRRSDGRLRPLLETTEAIPWEADAETWIFTYVGPQAVELFGYPREQWYEKDFWASHIHPNDRQWAVNYCLRCSSRYQRFDFEYRLISAQGESIWLHDLVTVELKEGVPHLLRGFMIDITERKQAENALAESERRFRLMADTAPVMIRMSGPDKLFTYFNKPWLDFTGRSLEEELGDGWAAGVHPDDLERCLETYKSAFEARRDFRMEYRLRRHDGEYRWMVDTGTPSPASDATLIGYIGSAIDITDLKRSETLQAGNYLVLEKLAMGQPLGMVLEELAVTIESQLEPDARCSILLMDEDGMHLRHGAAPNLPEEYNQAIEGLEIGPRVGSCGTAAHRGERVIVSDIRTDPLWKDYRDLATRFNLGSCWSEPIFSNSRQVLGSFAIYHSESRSPTQAECELIEKSASLAGVAIEQARREEALRELSGRLINAQETERRGLARELHDDLTQQMAVLAMEVADIERHSDLPDSVRRRMEGIQARLIRSSRDVHNLCRRLHPSILDDLGLKQAIRSECKTFSEQTRIEVEFDHHVVPEDLPREMALSLYRIAQEGLRNIAKHSQSPRARVELSNSDGEIRLIVQDSGVGFLPEKAKGKVGLGLVSMKERARMSGGELTVQSLPGEGTRIQVRIPLGDNNG